MEIADKLGELESRSEWKKTTDSKISDVPMYGKKNATIASYLVGAAFRVFTQRRIKASGDS